jgi:uncharacterized membrane protein YccF (DUF307 family)
MTSTQDPNVTVVDPGGPGLLIRAIWFIFVGWWLSGLAIAAAWFCAATIIGLPATWMLVNRLGAIQTLRSRTIHYESNVGADGTVTHTRRHVEQLPILLRIVYFPLGLLLGGIWMTIAWLLSLTIVLLPVSILMLNRTPAVMTLQRN